MSSDNVRTGFTSNWLRTTVDVMEPKEIGFVHPPRKWQAECFETIAPNTPIAFINAPTGSGKSTMLSMLAYQRTVSDFKKKTIIAVPQTVIGKGFKTKVFKLPDGQVIDWSVGLDLVSDSDDCINQLTNFISDDIYYSKEYPFERIAVCSYNVLRDAFHRLSDEDKEKYWDNLLICIDETHHLQMNEISDGVYEMNKLSQVVDYSFKNNNNEIILVSATMFRGDKKGLISNEMISQAINYKLPFDIYMGEMNYLKSFSYDFVIDTGNYTNDISKSIKNLFDDNLKKLFIYIPHTTHFMSTGNKNREDKKSEIKEILHQLKIVLNGESISLNEKTGVYHIQNSCGLDYKVCDLYDEELFDSKTKHFVNDQKINEDRDSLDCIITMNRAKEGFDWEHANGMIVVGQRNSLTDVIQMVGRLLRDKQGKEKVKALHMLPFSPNQPTAPNLDNSLNDFFKAIAISLLMEDVFAPTPLQTNEDSAPTGQLSGSSSPSVSSNIFDDLELDENQRADLFDKAQKSLVNIAGGLVESQGTYSPEELKEQMPSIMKQWIAENTIQADEDQIEQLAKKVYNQFAKRTLQMQGINVSNINWQMIESANPIEFTLRYVGKDTTLESLKELRRLIASGESESNVRTHELCKFILQNNRTPVVLNEQEKTLSHFLSDMRKAYKNPTAKGRTFYHSNQLIAESYGMKDLFLQTLEELSNLKTFELCEFVKLNDRTPIINSENDVERKLATFYHNSKAAKSGKKLKGNAWYSSNQKIAESYDLPNLFDYDNQEIISNIQTHDLCKWIEANNRIPTRTSISDDAEKTIYNLLTVRRKAKSGKMYTWYDSNQEIAESYGLHNIFDIKNPEQESNSITKELCEWVLKNNTNPKQRSTEENEKKLARFLLRKKQAKIGKFNSAWFESDQEIAESYGLSDLFEITKNINKTDTEN